MGIGIESDSLRLQLIVLHFVPDVARLQTITSVDNVCECVCKCVCVCICSVMLGGFDLGFFYKTK